MNRQFLAGLLIGAMFWLPCGMWIGRAAPLDTGPRVEPGVVRAAMVVVEAALVEAHPLLKGYSETEPPVAIGVYWGPRGRAGSFDGRVIRVNDDRPTGCRVVDLVHEVAHHALGLRYGMTPRQSEPYAVALDILLTDDRPNCAEVR